MTEFKRLADQYKSFTPIPSVLRHGFTAKEKSLTDKYPSLIEFPIAWGDQDTFGHVNNIMYLRYFESGRAAYLAQMQRLDGSSEDSFMEYLQSNAGNGVIVKNISCSYYSPVVYPDRLIVAVRVNLKTMKKDRFQMEFIIVSRAQTAIVAQGNGTIVTFDYKKKMKMDIPKDFLEATLKFESSVGNVMPSHI